MSQFTLYRMRPYTPNQQAKYVPPSVKFKVRPYIPKGASGLEEISIREGRDFTRSVNKVKGLSNEI